MERNWRETHMALSRNPCILLLSKNKTLSKSKSKNKPERVSLVKTCLSALLRLLMSCDVMYCVALLTSLADEAATRNHEMYVCNLRTESVV